MLADASIAVDGVGDWGRVGQNDISGNGDTARAGRMVAPIEQHC